MIVLEILKYTLPSVVVFLTAYFLIKQQNDKESSSAQLDLKKQAMEKTRELVLPIRLQAYERLILFLQRIHPNQMVIRVSRPEYMVHTLQNILIKTVRDEFEHNMSQQLYVSDRAWSKVVHAREECIRLINLSASQLKSDAKGTDLGARLIQAYGDLQPDPIKQAIAQLKDDINNGL